MRHPRSTRQLPFAPGLAPLAVLATLAALGACGGAPAATGGAGGQGGSEGGAGGEGGLSFGGSGGTGGGPVIDESDACAKAVVVGEPVPVTMFLLFDKSGSMLDDQKWAGAKAALTAFFQNPASAGLRVALRFFPDDGCDAPSCDVNACAVPLVDVGELTASPASGDPQQAALVEAVNATSPSGETPMYAALAGAEKWAVEHVAPTEKMAVVLVTDGEPNGCNEDLGAIAGLASEAYASAGVLTYAIGMQGSNVAQVDTIAQAGGTGSAFVVGVESVHTALLGAFNQIKTAAIACSYALPTAAEAGAEVDPSLVNVNFTSGGVTSTLPQVASLAACGATGGWYYDDPASPTSVELCPTTCDFAQGDLDAQVKILLGCATVAN